MFPHRVLQMAASLGGSGGHVGSAERWQVWAGCCYRAEKVTEASPCGINLVLGPVDALWVGMEMQVLPEAYPRP